MGGIFGYIVRIVVVAVIVVVTVWPTYGVLWLVANSFPVHPLLASAGGAIWVIILTLAAPLTLRQFRLISTTAFTGITAIGLYSGYTYFPGAVLGAPWYIWAALIVGLGFGWWKISTPLWRWANGIVAVQNTVTPEHHDQ